MKKFLYTFAGEFTIIEAIDKRDADEILAKREPSLSWAWVFEGQLV